MLDIEYISELAIAYLNGVQNKKTKLEDFYQLYENEFDDADRVRQLFFNVLGEISQMLPEIRSTRFRKKSDFYTLFLVLAALEKELPFSAEVRTALNKALLEFANQVDQYLSQGATEGVSVRVFDYADNVERAASDLGSRRMRHQALAAVVADTLRATSGAQAPSPAFTESGGS
jgi:hypothetical protein